MVLGNLPVDGLLFNCDNEKGILQTKPPTNPNAANCHSGSEPDAPKDAPQTGIKKVRNAMANNMPILDLVARATRTAIKRGTTKATPNSHKSNILSVVKASSTRLNDKPVTNPTRPPTSQTLIALLVPLAVDTLRDAPHLAQNWASSGLSLPHV
jgi:hypothetical protein